VVADVNGDGHPDLVVSSANVEFSLGDEKIRVLLGNGDGSFQTIANPDTGVYLSSVAVADVNGDGKPDLVLTNSSLSGTVGVLLGNGDGSFQDRQSVLAGVYASSLVVADVNGDGRPDLVLSDDQSVSVLLGNGDGTFQAPQTVMTGTGLTVEAVADLTGDGKLDLVVLDQGSTSVDVLLGNGDGTFQAPRSVDLLSGGFLTVEVADLNGDGKPDLVVGYISEDRVSVLLGNGDGTFQAPRPIDLSGLSGNIQFVQVADLNGDGKPDLIVGDNTTSSEVEVFLNQGDATFQALPPIATATNPRLLAVADLTGDGKPDLIMTYLFSTSLSVLLGNGDGSFQTPLTAPTNGYPESVDVADLNGDGRPDLVVSLEKASILPGNGGLAILMGNGDGTFTPFSSTSGVESQDTPDLADLNGDGIPDEVILDTSGNILFRKGLPGGDNPFASPTTINATVFDPRTGTNEKLTARALTVLSTGIASAIATADFHHDLGPDTPHRRRPHRSGRHARRPGRSGRRQFPGQQHYHRLSNGPWRV
jgi:hypothetical protein